MKFNSVIIILLFFIYTNIKSQVTFLPSNLSGLSLWLTSDSVSLSSGNSIDTCYDLSPNLNHAFQTNLSKQPISLNSTLNGHKAMQFDGVDDVVQFTGINNIRTVFWVVSEDNSATSNYRSLLGHSIDYSFLRGVNKEIWDASFSASEVKSGQTKVNFSNINGTSTILPTNYSIISCVTTGPLRADNFSSDRGIANRVWQGNMVELIIYNQALTTTEVTQVEQYLNDKYAPKVALPADIILTNTFCDTTITTNSSFTNYLWSNGLTTPTISVNQSGKFWVRATNVFGEVSSDTILVQYPTIAQPSKNYFCSKDTLIWDTQLSNSDFSFLWQNSNSDSLIKIYQPGPYFVTINDGFGCSVLSNTINITEDTFPVNASLGADILSCAGNYIFLTSGASPSLNYTWNDGSHNDSLLINITGQYSVVVTNTNNCIAKDTIDITILGQAPIANFTTSIGCNNSAVSFTDLSSTFSGNTINSYYWDFGDPLSLTSNTSSVNNPFHTFTDTGTFTVYLKIITNAPCEQSITKTIHIAETPTVNFSSQIACQNDSMQFINQSSNSIGYFTSFSLWNFGDAASGISNTSNFISPKHLYSSSGNYFVKLTVTNNLGCKDSLTKYITAIDNTDFNLPATIPGLKLWINGDCIHKTSSQVDTCYDLSSNFNHAIQTNTSKKPQAIPNSLNGHSVLKFDGVDDYLQFNPITDIRTVFWVAYEDTNATSTYRSLLGSRITNFYDFLRGQNKQVWDFQNANSNVQLGQTKINLSVINGTATVLPKNYALISTVTTGTVNADNFSNDRDITDRFWQGNLAELIIYNQALSPTQVTQVEQYLNDKYAPDVKLPEDITVTNSFCDTTITPNSSFVDYLWSNGATTPTISVNKSGKYWVDVINMFGKTSSDTILVTYPGNFLTQNSALCQGDSIIWNTNLPNNSYTFQWQNNSTDSTFTITQGGPYYVKVTDGNGCSATSNTITITQDNFQTTASLGNDTFLCSGNSITLTSGAVATNSYTWSTGSNNDSLLIINAGQYSVIVTNTNNCVAKDTIDIIIQGFAPTANFTTSIGCVNQTVSFADLSIPPSGNSISNYEWDFGDSASPTNTSTTSNPSHTYSNTGTYNVHLTVTTNSNCAQSVTKIINVYPVPTATFAIGTSCQNDSTAFLNQSTGAIGYSVTNSYWNFGDASSTATTTIISPKHMYTNASIYTVKLLVTNSVGCKDSLYKTVNVQSEVKANFTNGPACLNTTTQFQSTSIIPTSGTPTYDWNFSNNGNANTAAPIKTFTNTGVYSVTLTVDGNNGCTSTITKLVNVYFPPIASFSIPSFCAKDTTNIINLSNPQSGIISSYNWKLNNITFSSVQSPTLSLTNPGNNSVRLTTINSFGCKDSTTNSLIVFPLPVVDFSTTPTAFYYINEPINFTPSINNASSYLWNMNATSTYSIQNPTETFNTEGSFNISLNLKDQNGCKGSKTKNITVTERYLDLAVLKVNTNKDNNGFMTVVADIANYGSVPINSFKMGYQISDGGTIKETWNGTLNPNSFYTFTFNAESASTQNSVNNITCVEIEKVNTSIDDNTTNNSFCNSLNTNDIYVGNPLPNPTDGDIVLPITLNKDIDFTISIYNSVGKIQYEETTKKGIEGLNFVKLNTSSYARGAYIIKLMIDEKIFIKKFIKISYE